MNIEVCYTLLYINIVLLFCKFLIIPKSVVLTISPLPKSLICISCEHIISYDRNGKEMFYLMIRSTYSDSVTTELWLQSTEITQRNLIITKSWAAPFFY